MAKPTWVPDLTLVGWVLPNLRNNRVGFWCMYQTQSKFGSGADFSNTCLELEPESVVKLLKCPNYIYNHISKP